MWEGRGATARPREAERSSGVAAVFGVYYNNYFSKTNLDMTFTNEEHYIIMRQGRESEAIEAVFCIQAKTTLHSGSYEHA